MYYGSGMKIVIAPGAFKETLTAGQAAAAIGAGVIESLGGAVVDVCPVADGGPGTLDAMITATGGRYISADVFDPLGAPVRARFGILGTRSGALPLPGELGLLAAGAADEEFTPGEACTAVVEMAAASGLERISPERRDPLRTTTYGTGRLILAALETGATEIIVGLGGSATVDGGCGAAQALGVEFRTASGEPCVCGLAGGGLIDIGQVDMSRLDGRVLNARIRAACDVDNPLTGPKGAAAVFGPQKGATAEMVQRLEAGLRNLAAVVRRDVGIDIQNMPRGGAAGGLAAGLAAFARATLEKGFDMVARTVDLPARLAGADLCMTGEGRLDSQSSGGKTSVEVARMARAAGVPVACLCGQVAHDAPLGEFDDVRSLAGAGIGVRQAMSKAEELLKARAAELARAWRQR